jgi:AraC-like DNA-binding protein
MANDIFFSKSFLFNVFEFSGYRHNDNRKGVSVHYVARMISGNAKLVCGTETLTVNEGDIFYIPNGCRYQSFWYGKPDIKFISLGFTYMPDFTGQHYKIQKIDPFEEANMLFSEIAEEIKAINCKTIGRFYTLLGLLLPKMSVSECDRHTRLLQSAKEYLTSSPYSSAAELARACSVSESTIYSVFRKHSDMSINEYKISIIMERAKDMLISTDIPIEEISERLHFSSTSYFRKQFKQHFGTSPRHMRKSYKI